MTHLEIQSESKNVHFLFTQLGLLGWRQKLSEDLRDSSDMYPNQENEV